MRTASATRPAHAWLPFAVGALAASGERQEGNNTLPALQVPEFECTVDPALVEFRDLVLENAANGFPDDAELSNVAAAVVQSRLKHITGDHRKMAAALLKPALHTEEEHMQAVFFCVYGIVNALAILAYHDWNVERDNALAKLRLVANILYYDRYDFITSTSWPWTSYEVLRNLKQGAAVCDFILPRRDGDRSVEVPAPSGLPFTTPVWEGMREPDPVVATQLRFFSLDTHCSAAAELHYIFSMWGADVEFHSFDLLRCNRHRPHLCPTMEVDADLAALLPISVLDEAGIVGFHDAHLEDVISGFQALARARLADKDLFICSMPAVWCLLYELLDKPVLGFIPQTLLLWVPWRLRRDILDRLLSLSSRADVVLAVVSQFAAEQFKWQTGGYQLPVVRYTGMSHGATHNPGYTKLVAMSKRPSEEFQHVIFMFAVVHAETLSLKLLPHPQDSHFDMLCNFRAYVYLAYDVNTMMLHELYACGIPMWVPADLWRYASRFGELYSEHLLFDGVPSSAEGHPYPPVMYDRLHLDVDAAIYWSSFHEARRLPHLHRFLSVPDLLLQLQSVSEETLREVSEKMKVWSSTEAAKAGEFWRHATSSVLNHARPSTTSKGETPPA